MMRAVNCVVPLVVRLRGTPGPERLAQLIDAIGQTVAGRLRTADRVITVREGCAIPARTIMRPVLHFSGVSLPDDQRHRIAQAVEAGLARALSGGAGGAASPFVLAQYVPPGGGASGSPSAPAAVVFDDGIRIAQQRLLNV